MSPITDTFQIEVALNKRLDPANRSPRPRGMFSGEDGDTYLAQVPLIKCADGLTMSVQTGSALYCSSRNSRGPWSAVEVGFPSRKVEGFMPYIDGEDSDPTDTVYGYVPLHIVIAAICEAGGPLP